MLILYIQHVLIDFLRKRDFTKLIFKIRNARAVSFRAHLFNKK